MPTINAKDYLNNGEATGIAISNEVTSVMSGMVLPYVKDGKDIIAIAGTSGVEDIDGKPLANRGVGVYGSFLEVQPQSIYLGLNAPAIGDMLVVSGLTGDGKAILGLQPPSPDAYFVEAIPSVYAGQIASGTSTSSWTDINLEITITQALVANNFNAYIKVFATETGGEWGNMDIGVGVNDAVPSIYQRIIIAEDTAQPYSVTDLGASDYPAGTKFKIWVRGTGEKSSYRLNIDGGREASTFRIAEINPQAGIAVSTISDLLAGVSDSYEAEFEFLGNNPTRAELNTLFSPDGTKDLSKIVKDSTNGKMFYCNYNKTDQNWYYEKLTKAI